MNYKITTMKYKITTMCLVFSFTYSFAQILTNQNPSSSASTSFAFIDAGSSSTYNGVANAGKGIIYPRTDLTAVTSFLDSGSLGSASYNPNYYDGIVVYNTATSGTAGIGSTEGTLSAGFWYYENTSGNSTGGTWRPLGGAGGGSVTLDATPKDSDLSIDGVQEKVVRLSGTADGTTTHIDLGTSVLAANTVGTFRKAIIYNGTTGHIVMESTGSYDSATNKFVTGNGMMNVLLPAATYTVELYYTE